jgi:hypothetical protein
MQIRGITMKTSRRDFLRFLPAAVAVAVAAPAVAKALPRVDNKWVIPLPGWRRVNRGVIRTSIPVVQWRKLQGSGILNNEIFADLKWIRK